MYEVQQHGEWSGRDDVLDLDYEAETLEEAREIIRTEIPKGVIYVLTGPDVQEEGVR